MELDQDTLDAINEAHQDANDFDGFHVKAFVREMEARGLRIVSAAQVPPPLESAANSVPALYVGAMNDGLFIIDKPPSPSGTDVPPHYNPNGPNVIAKMAITGREADRLARMFVAAPEVLEALKEYVRDFGDNEDADSRRMANKARAALSKAEGPAAESAQPSTERGKAS